MVSSLIVGTETSGATVEAAQTPKVTCIRPLTLGDQHRAPPCARIGTGMWSSVRWKWQRGRLQMVVTEASSGRGQKGEHESQPAHSLPRRAGTGPAKTHKTPSVIQVSHPP